MRETHLRGSCVAALIALSSLSGCGDKTVKHVLKGAFEIPAEEVAAVKELVESSNLKPEQVKAFQGYARCYSCPHVLISNGHVQRIKLENAGVTKMSKIAALKGLRRLSLRGNKIQEAAGFCSLPQLEELDLSKNALTKLSPGQGCMALRTLRLNDNQLTTLDGLAGLPMLRLLYLAQNKLTSIAGLKNAPKLVSLDVSKQQLTKLEGLEGLEGLTTLKASHNQIASLAGFLVPRKLTSLDVSSNKLTSLGGLKTSVLALGSLDASHNQIADLRLPPGSTPEPGTVRAPQPGAGRERIYIKSLKLDHNKLTSLDGIEHYRFLKTLSVKNNKIASLAPLKKGAPLLAALYVDNNALTSLTTLSGREPGAEVDPAEKKRAAAQAKAEAKARRRRMARLSPALRARMKANPRLKALFEQLGRSKIRSGGNYLLKRLTASHNQLTSLAGIETAIYLKTLDVSYNRITTLQGIEQLTSLEELIVSHNLLTSVAGLRRLRLLKVVVATDNKLSNKDEVFVAGRRPTWSYYDFRRNIFVGVAAAMLYRGVTSSGTYVVGGYRRSRYGGYGMRGSRSRYGYGGGGYRSGK